MAKGALAQSVAVAAKLDELNPAENMNQRNQNTGSQSNQPGDASNDELMRSQSIQRPAGRNTNAGVNQFVALQANRFQRSINAALNPAANQPQQPNDQAENQQNEEQDAGAG